MTVCDLLAGPGAPRKSHSNINHLEDGTQTFEFSVTISPKQTSKEAEAYVKNWLQESIDGDDILLSIKHMRGEEITDADKSIKRRRGELIMEKLNCKHCGKSCENHFFGTMICSHCNPEAFEIPGMEYTYYEPDEKEVEQLLKDSNL